MLCRIVVNAPRGSLGIWVDDSSSNQILNVVSHVNDDGPSAGKVLVGDQIMKVNGVDVHRMSAAEISNLFVQHRDNEKVITIARTVYESKSERERPVDTDVHVDEEAHQEETEATTAERSSATSKDVDEDHLIRSMEESAASNISISSKGSNQNSLMQTATEKADSDSDFRRMSTRSMARDAARSLIAMAARREDDAAKKRAAAPPSAVENYSREYGELDYIQDDDGPPMPPAQMFMSFDEQMDEDDAADKKRAAANMSMTRDSNSSSRSSVVSFSRDAPRDDDGPPVPPAQMFMSFEEQMDKDDAAAKRRAAANMPMARDSNSSVSFSHDSNRDTSTGSTQLISPSQMNESEFDRQILEHSYGFQVDDAEQVQETSVSSNASTNSTAGAIRPETEPTFYEVEAHLVRESAGGGPTLPVYDAEPMPKLPFWKRNARGVIIVMVIMFATITGTIVGIMLPKLQDNTTPTPSPTPPPYLYNSCASYIGPLLEEACDGCSPPVEINGNDTLAVIKKDNIQFFSHSTGGIDNVTTLGIDYKVISTAMSGNTAIVGAPEENSFTGAVYVYEKDPLSGEWSQTSHINRTDLSEGTQFGRYVDIDEDVIVVGSYDYTGSVYVYRRIDNKWVNETKLDPRRSTNKDFGKTVKVKGRRIAVGDRLFGWKPEGAVFLYEYNSTSEGWEKLPDGMSVISHKDCAGRFGVHLYLAGNDELMIGCPKDDDWTGSVYYYSRPEEGQPYEFRQRIQASDGTDGNRFGQTQQIEVEGDLMTIGQYLNVGGKAYVYLRTDAGDGGYNWTEVASIPEPPDVAAEEGLYFSDQLALSGTKMVVSNTENAYVYELEACLPVNQTLFS